jgi:cellulose synthase/poly-beta-1,6-N-acetylglucosamine synthase-like glycosyltransferase
MVSIIVPTYNRAKFLPDALESIRNQTWTGWELILVDDGSKDDTAAVVERLTPRMGRPVRYVRRENGGPGAARNTGLDHAKGKFVAFLDSDDCWLPHHLTDCVSALDGSPEVSWIFSAGRRVDHQTKRVLIEHTMYGNHSRPSFLDLRTRQVGALRIFDDPSLLSCALRSGGFAGLQSSMVRREVFSKIRFQPMAIFEDRLAFMRAVAEGFQMGYLDDVHVIVYSHGENTSFASDKALESRLASTSAYVKAMEGLAEELCLSRREFRALRANQGEESFWQLGYLLVQHGRYRDALPWMRYGLRCCPGNIRFWKTYLATNLKALLA